MTQIEVPTVEDIYNIALLVHKGWVRGYDGRWIHPHGKKFPKIQNCFNKVIEEDSWPLDHAMPLTKLREQIHTESFC